MCVSLSPCASASYWAERVKPLVFCSCAFSFRAAFTPVIPWYLEEKTQVTGWRGHWRGLPGGHCRLPSPVPNPGCCLLLVPSWNDSNLQWMVTYVTYRVLFLAWISVGSLEIWSKAQPRRGSVTCGPIGWSDWALTALTGTTISRGRTAWPSKTSQLNKAHSFHQHFFPIFYKISFGSNAVSFSPAIPTISLSPWGNGDILNSGLKLFSEYSALDKPFKPPEGKEGRRRGSDPLEHARVCVSSASGWKAGREFSLF